MKGNSEPPASNISGQNVPFKSSLAYFTGRYRTIENTKPGPEVTLSIKDYSASAISDAFAVKVSGTDQEFYF